MTSCLLAYIVLYWRSGRVPRPSMKQQLRSLSSSSRKVSTWKMWVQPNPKAQHWGSRLDLKKLSLGKLPVPWSWEIQGPGKGEALSCQYSWVAERLTPFSGPANLCSSTFWHTGRGNIEAVIHSFNPFIYEFKTDLPSARYVPGTTPEVLGRSGGQTQALPPWSLHSSEEEERPVRSQWKMLWGKESR